MRHQTVTNPITICLWMTPNMYRFTQVTELRLERKKDSVGGFIDVDSDVCQ